MTSSESGFQNADGIEAKADDPGRRVDRQFLTELLQTTLVSRNPAETLESGDLDALREVYRRHHTEPFGLDPVSIDLVRAMLESYYKTWTGATTLLTAMSADIAQSLFDNPACRQRLERLWTQLGEVS